MGDIIKAQNNHKPGFDQWPPSDNVDTFVVQAIKYNSVGDNLVLCSVCLDVVQLLALLSRLYGTGRISKVRESKISSFARMKSQNQKPRL